MTLSVSMINNSPSFVNIQNERELDLRNNNIVKIDNTSATLNYFQTIDLSSNSIRSLTNFTYLDQLKSLIACNNRIKDTFGLSSSLPQLENLVLMGNKIQSFFEVKKLGNCQCLKRLVLISNPVYDEPNYRQITISLIPSLIVLDFKKITPGQRVKAEAFYRDSTKK